MVNKLGQDIIPTNIDIKLDNDPINMISKGQAELIWTVLAYSRAITPKVFPGIWLVIELGQEIMPTNNVIKFDDDPLKKYSSNRADTVYFGNFG